MKNSSKFSHYYKKIPEGLEYIDVYRVLDIFGISNPCIQHAVKKLLVAGVRGTKDEQKDVEEAIASLERFLEMRSEEKSAENAFSLDYFTDIPSHENKGKYYNNYHTTPLYNGGVQNCTDTLNLSNQTGIETIKVSVSEPTGNTSFYWGDYQKPNDLVIGGDTEITLYAEDKILNLDTEKQLKGLKQPDFTNLSVKDFLNNWKNYLNV
jgi:hypothetical protein